MDGNGSLDKDNSGESGMDELDLADGSSDWAVESSIGVRGSCDKSLISIGVTGSSCSGDAESVCECSSE